VQDEAQHTQKRESPKDGDELLKRMLKTPPKPHKDREPPKPDLQKKNTRRDKK